MAEDDGDDAIDDEIWEYCRIDMYGASGGLQIQSEETAERPPRSIAYDTIQSVERASGTYYLLFGLKLTLKSSDRALLLIPNGRQDMDKLLQTFERQLRAD